MARDEKTMAVVTLLQGYLANADLTQDGRLPAERVLAETLAVSRPEIRKALDVLEGTGQVWRHVGKGTFLGPRPVASVDTVLEIAKQTDISAVMEARIKLEPTLAGMAAKNATTAQIDAMSRLTQQSWTPDMSWRAFEGLDANLHRMIATAAGNTVLLHLFDELSVIRRAVTWARTRSDPSGPPQSHHSFYDHIRIVEAISGRNADDAERYMTEHLSAVRVRF
ncbi:FadR/GntR family transcriptional regulator [Rhizobium sp. HT1-10]|uniref:FadR/GntR family transcriptional regulator n=1 Tax=Rhizobium sp. HT1-10 TaxID=3111638 RepID=UPI003C288A45